MQAYEEGPRRHILIRKLLGKGVPPGGVCTAKLYAQTRMATIPDLPANDLSHPGWLRNALANPKRIWSSYNLLTQREEARSAARAQSRETLGLGAESPEEHPFSTWSACVVFLALTALPP